MFIREGSPARHASGLACAVQPGKARPQNALTLGACRTYFRVCDGGALAAVPGASPKAYRVYGEGEQRRNAANTPRPSVLLPKNVSASLLGLRIYPISAAP